MKKGKTLALSAILVISQFVISCQENTKANETSTEKEQVEQADSNELEQEAELNADGEVMSMEQKITAIDKELKEFDMNDQEIGEFKQSIIENQQAENIEDALSSIETESKIEEGENTESKIEPNKEVQEKKAPALKKIALNPSPRTFIKKDYAIKGNWSLKQEGDKVYIVLHSNFKTKNGPDLKIFLTKQSMANVTGKSALRSSVFIKELKSNKGEQRYLVPSKIDISKYTSMLIHCEKYAILWGGGKL